jgi:hypothetical protein
MATDLEAVAIVAQMVGVMDHPCRQPQHLALQIANRRHVKSAIVMLGSRQCGPQPNAEMTGAKAIKNGLPVSD